MAVYLDVFNLIVNKEAVIQKYTGGIAQFRIDYNLPSSAINQEDDELFALGQMNSDEFDIERLVAKGLHFDAAEQTSNDFTIVYRYGDLFWEANWIKHNRVFAWHTATDPAVLQKVHDISNMTMDEINASIRQGQNPLRTISMADLG